MEVTQDGFFQQAGVQFGDAVNRTAADAGEVRHPHAPPAVLVDQRQPVVHAPALEQPQIGRAHV